MSSLPIDSFTRAPEGPEPVEYKDAPRHVKGGGKAGARLRALTSHPGGVNPMTAGPVLSLTLCLFDIANPGATTVAAGPLAGASAEDEPNRPAPEAVRARARSGGNLR